MPPRSIDAQYAGGSSSARPREAERAADVDGRAIARADRIARWLDDAMLDPILGFFFPGAGDLVGSGAGLCTVGVAVRHGLPRVVIARMVLNLSIDAAVGSIPIVGDLFDLFFKAHRRNARLLRERHRSGQAETSDWLWIGGAAVAFVAALSLPLIVLLALISVIF